MWAQGVEAQRAQKAVLDSIRDMKGFDWIRRDRQKQGHGGQQMDKVDEENMVEN